MGRAMLPHARAALADAERARTAARRAVGLDGGEIQVASVYSPSPYMTAVLQGKEPWRAARIASARITEALAPH